MGKCVMVVGLGDLGGWVLEFLARSNGVSKIVTADVREDYGLRKTNSAAISASVQGYFKKFEFHKLDLNDIEATSTLIKNTEPDIIYTAATMQSWWVRSFLPEEIFAKLSVVGGGPLVPLQITLPYKLMQAVKKSGVTTHVLNHASPDFTNAALWRKGFGPTLGAGNTQLLADRLRYKISQLENVPISDITVFAIGIHANVIKDPMKHRIPRFIKIMMRDRDVTKNHDLDTIISQFVRARPPVKLVSWLTHPQVASSAVKNILGILNDTGELSHAPGPNGLVGGYPVRLTAKGVDVVLPEELNLEEAIKINNDGLWWDGYEEIKEDGTMVFSKEACEVYGDVLGINIPRELQLEDAEERAKELSAAYDRLAKKHNVPTYIY